MIYDKDFRMNYTEKARKIVEQLSLEEKVALMGGNQNLQEMLELLDMDESQHYNCVPFTSGGNETYDIPQMKFCDGPRGVVCGVGKSTCFPVSMCRGATFDTELEEKIGQAIGQEVRGFGGNLFAGVCVNLAYHPGWGRSQETYGEESFHLGQMGAALTRGVQSENVIACVKHYAFNQMEISRFKVSVECDKRTEREVFLPHFKEVIDAGAASVMSSYNLFQGVHCGHHHYLLDQVLKKEWDFDGFVMSDFLWGVTDTVEAANGGQDMEMCATQFYGSKLVQAVKDGFVSEEKINDAAERIIRTLISVEDAYKHSLKQYDASIIGSKDHIQLALQSAREGITLIKNTNNFLPLQREKIKKLVVLGKLAEKECIGDHGSSQVYPPYVITPLQGIRQCCTGINVVYNDGSSMVSVAAEIADADAVIIVAGYDYNDEGEYVSENENEAYTGAVGGDRQSLELHTDEIELIRTVSQLNKHTAVVMIGGNTILLNGWDKCVPAIMMAYYPGMEGGRAIAEILFGQVNPSGKLPFVIPEKASDLPEIQWDTTSQYYQYYHGYTRLEKHGIAPKVPYGFGLSYTTFKYSEAHFEQKDNQLCASCIVTNTGDRDGDEVVQLYVGFELSSVDRPVKLLRGFKRIHLEAKASKCVEIICPIDQLRYYDPVKAEMVLEDMVYQVYIGSSSATEDLLKGTVRITG